MDLLGEEEASTIPESVRQNLLLPQEDQSSRQATEPLVQAVIPEAGFCIKTKTDKGEKVFINICKSEQIPSPKDITDEQLQALLQSGDPTQYRVPLSLGEPHTETDNAGKDCRTYDVIISSKFFETIEQRPAMKDFLLTVVMEGLEDKYSILLSRACRVMKNRTFMGSLPEQTVRSKAKPFIIEVDSGTQSTTGSGTRAGESSSNSDVPEPPYTIAREPIEGELPQFLVVEVQLPGMSSSKHLRLEVGEDRLVLKTRPNLFHLDIDLPYLVDSEETGAQFHRQNKVLTVTLPVTGSAPV